MKKEEAREIAHEIVRGIDILARFRADQALCFMLGKNDKAAEREDDAERTKKIIEDALTLLMSKTDKKEDV